jgi:sec-independent protein translocase protein TatA
MVGDLFDSPWKILIVAVVIIVLFGSKKLPQAARSLGQSMRIMKKEVGSLHDDEQESPAPANAAAAPFQQAPFQQPEFPQPQLAAAPAPVDQQAQIDALQQQLRDMQRAAAMDDRVPEPQHTQPR